METLKIMFFMLGIQIINQEDILKIESFNFRLLFSCGQVYNVYVGCWLVVQKYFYLGLVFIYYFYLCWKLVIILYKDIIIN